MLKLRPPHATTNGWELLRGERKLAECGENGASPAAFSLKPHTVGTPLGCTFTTQPENLWFGRNLGIRGYRDDENSECLCYLRNGRAEKGNRELWITLLKTNLRLQRCSVLLIENKT